MTLRDALAQYDGAEGPCLCEAGPIVAAARRVVEAPEWLNTEGPFTSADLRALRARLNVTQRWVADRMNVHDASVSRWEDKEGPLKGAALGALFMLQTELVRKLLVDPPEENHAAGS